MADKESKMAENSRVPTPSNRPMNANRSVSDNMEELRRLKAELKEIKLLSEAQERRKNLREISKRLPGCDRQTIAEHMCPSEYNIYQHEISDLNQRADKLLQISPNKDTNINKSPSVSLKIYRDGKEEGEITVKRTMSVDKLMKEMRKKLKTGTMSSITKSNGAVIFDHNQHDWNTRLRDYGVKDGDRIICF